MHLGIFTDTSSGDAGSPGAKGAVDGLSSALRALAFQGLARSWRTIGGQQIHELRNDLRYSRF